jgi:hypothetical protein
MITIPTAVLATVVSLFFVTWLLFAIILYLGIEGHRVTYRNRLSQICVFIAIILTVPLWMLAEVIEEKS